VNINLCGNNYEVFQRFKNKEKEGKYMKKDMNKSMEMMKKIIEEKKAKSSSQRNTKRAPIHGNQSSASGGQGLYGKYAQG
jgi:hypothetical protein